MIKKILLISMVVFGMVGCESTENLESMSNNLEKINSNLQEINKNIGELNQSGWKLT